MDDKLINIGTIFITGISAAGKTTLSKCLERDLVNEGVENVILLDGEGLRQELRQSGRIIGFSTEDRNNFSIEIARKAFDYNSNGKICIVCTISHVKNIREKMRAIIGNIMEVYLDCPVDVCSKRDYKGNYQKAYDGLYDCFVGVTDEYQVSDKPELILKTGVERVEESSKILLKEAMNFIMKGNKTNREEF